MTSTQRYLLLLSGLLSDGVNQPPPVSTGIWPTQSTDQTALELDFICQGVLAQINPALFQLSLDAGAGPVLQPGVYSIAAGVKASTNAVASLLVPANNYLGIQCNQASGISDLACWITLTTPIPVGTAAPWTGLTINDLAVHISAPELAAFTQTILQAGQPDTVSGLINDMIIYVRGFVSRGGNVMGIEGTIPQELTHITIDLVKQHLFNRVASLKIFADSMKDSVTEDMKILERVADGKFNVSLPITSPLYQMQVSASAQIATPRSRVLFSRHRLDGIQ